MKPAPEALLDIAPVLHHLQQNGLLGEFDAAALAQSAEKAFGRAAEQVTESEVLELLWRHYGPGRVIGVAAGERSVKDAVILFKESHDLEGDGEEEEAQRGILAVLAPFGVSLEAEDLEDLGDHWHVKKAIGQALARAGRSERAWHHVSPQSGISILLLRENLVPGVLSFFSSNR
ncbi:MAG: hypothetical protein QM820_06505 [Minicystis sp.]